MSERDDIVRDIAIDECLKVVRRNRESMLKIATNQERHEDDRKGASLRADECRIIEQGIEELKGEA